MFRRAFCIAIAAAPLLVAAQDVRTQSAFGSGTAAIRRKAEKQGFPWPYFSKGGKGTAVIFSFDFGDADVTILTEKTVKEDDLLRIAKDLSMSIGKPTADFIKSPSRGASYIDIELNDYLVKPARLQSEFDHQVGEVVSRLRTSALPQPVVVAVECDSADTVIPSALVGAGRKWKDVEYFRAEDIPSNYIVSFAVKQSWLVYPIAAALPLLFLGVPIGFIIRLRKEFKSSPESKESGSEVAQDLKKPLEEVQEEYMKSKSGLLILPLMLPLLVLPIVFARPSFMKLIDGSFDLLPNGLTAVIAGSMPILILCAVVLQFILARRQRSSGPAKEPANPATALMPLLFVLVFLMLLMLAAMFWPGFFFGSLSPTLRRWIVFGIMSVAFGATILSFVRQASKSRTRLQPGDVWHDRTMEMARKAGVRIWMVSIVDSDVVNAYATPWNTVGLTRPLLSKLDKREVEAVIAHELGHHKYAHAKAMFALSLAIVALYIFGLQTFRDTLKAANAPEWAQLITVGPLPMFLFILLIQPVALGFVRRRNEFRADQFAADLVGDSEVMVSALMKMAYENQGPTDLKRMDEFLASHPSISKRVAALRSFGQGTVSQPN
jgi:Zn-dependent protease with chaperone function